MSPLTLEAFDRGITPPAQRTLDTYGITQDEWIALLKAQDWKCPICLKERQRWNTDHEHVPRWKLMPPEERKRYVRGVLCWHCNHKKVGAQRDAAQAQRIADYLAAYEARRSGVERGTCRTACLRCDFAHEGAVSEGHRAFTNHDCKAAA